VFERFTDDARAVVKGAVAEAARRDSPAVGVEHVLVLLARTEPPASPVTAAALAGAGLTPDGLAAVLDDLDLTARRGGLGAADAAALQSLGIDVDAIVAGVEQVPRPRGARTAAAGFPQVAAAARPARRSAGAAARRGGGCRPPARSSASSRRCGTGRGAPTPSAPWSTACGRRSPPATTRSPRAPAAGHPVRRRPGGPRALAARGITPEKLRTQLNRAS
jgi:hypothetical protein